MFWVFLLFVLPSYASDYEPLTVITIDTNSSGLLEYVKESYAYNIEFFANGKVYFYDIFDEKIKGYPCNNEFVNFFLQNKTFLDVVQSKFWQFLTPEQRDTIPKKNLKHVCNAIRTYVSDRSTADMLYQKMSYNIKYFLYTIESCKGALGYKKAYYSFLKRSEKCITDYYASVSSVDNDCVKVSCGTMCFMTLALGLGLGLGVPNNPVPALVSIVPAGVIIPFSFFLCWQGSNRYKKCMDTIHQLQIEAEQGVQTEVDEQEKVEIEV